MGKIFENLFKKPQSQKKVQIYWQGDLMAIKKSNLLHMFIGKMLANMTQVSDVAPGPLVFRLAVPMPGCATRAAVLYPNGDICGLFVPS
jgi:hypothetical protein